jgi:uncharacterized membrane protein YbhN (UPF0104 family)
VSDLAAVLWQTADRVSDPFGRLDARLAAVALLCQAVNLALRAAAWRNVLGAAYPERRIPTVKLGAAYTAGVALNGFLPARAGDGVKIALARLLLPGSAVATIASAGLTIVAFDALVGAFLISFAWATGALPATPHLPPFASAAGGKPLVLIAATACLLRRGGVAARRLARVARTFVADLKRGGAILGMPRRYVRTVLSLQLAGWAARIAGAFALLSAFGMPATIRLAMLVVVLGGLSTIVPGGPGGAGAQQVLLVYALHGAVASASALSFSIAMQVTVTATNAVLGIVAAMVFFGTVRPLAAVAAATRAARR